MKLKEMGNNAATGILQSPPPTTTTKQRIYIDDDDDDDNHDDDDGYSMKCHADDAEDDRNASPTLPNCNTVGEINKDDSGTTMMNISSPASNASTTVGHDGNGSVADNDEATPPPATTDLTTPALANMDFEKFELSITEGGDRHSKEEEDDMNRDECQQKRPRSGNGNIISNVGEEDSSSSMLLLASDKHWKTYSSNDVDDAILNELNVLVECINTTIQCSTSTDDHDTTKKKKQLLQQQLQQQHLHEMSCTVYQSLNSYSQKYEMGQPANTGSGGNIPNDNDCQFSGDSCTENENDDDNNNDIASNDYSNKAIKRKKKKEKSSDNRVKELGKRSSDIVLRQVVFSSCKTREKFRTIGRTIWMTIRAHPEAFYDHVAQVIRQQDLGNNNNNTKSEKENKNHDDDDEANIMSKFRRHRAAASGYIRAIAARLILIDHLITTNPSSSELESRNNNMHLSNLQYSMFPQTLLSCVMSKTIGKNEEKDEELRSSQPKQDRNNKLDVPVQFLTSGPTKEEWEFGVKSFARAGRAILQHGDINNNNNAWMAYQCLELAVEFWEGLVLLTSEKLIRPEDTDMASNASPRSLVNSKCLDDAFDAMSLLPDAASLVNAAKSIHTLRSQEIHSERKADNDDSKDPLRHSASHENVGEERISSSSARRNMLDIEKKAITLQPLIGSSAHVISLLRRFEIFISQYCYVAGDEKKGSENEGALQVQMISAMCTQRYLPCLARVSYKPRPNLPFYCKHGNRFARLQDYHNSRAALQIALSSTDRCLGEIRTRISAAAQPPHRSTNPGVVLARSTDTSSRHNLTSLHLQEQELLVISRECFYVLAHVCQAMGKSSDAYKCLDRVQVYIEEQSKRNDELYESTIENIAKDEMNDPLGGSADGMKRGRIGVVSSSLLSSDLALVGPKQQDREDIKARAQAARAKGRHLEFMDRASLAYSRIMIVNNEKLIPSSPLIEERKEYVDQQLALLGEICDKSTRSGFSAVSIMTGKTIDILPQVRTSEDVFQLALSACRNVCVRRLTESPLENVSEGKFSPLRHNAYDLLFSGHAESYEKSVVVGTDHLNAILVSIQIWREKLQSSEANTLTKVCAYVRTLDEKGLAVAETLLKHAKKHCADGVHGFDSALVNTDRTQNRLTLLEETRLHFVRAVSMYRGWDEKHKTCSMWCDRLISLLSMLEDEESVRGAPNQQYKHVNEAFDNNQVRADILAVKAYSLSMGGDAAAGVNAARMAWKAGMPSPTVHIMTVLFHCILAHLVKGDSPSPADDSHVDTVFLELDSCISHLLTSVDLAKVDDILDCFPVLANSCMSVKDNEKGNNVLLAIQKRWISALLGSTSFLGAVKFTYTGCHENGKKKSKVICPPGSASLFCVLRSYLSTYEQFLTNLDYDAIDPLILNYGGAIDKSLAEVLVLLDDMRSRDHSRCTKGRRGIKGRKKVHEVNGTSRNDVTLIWDDKATQEYVGRRADCIWIAEQLWNLGTKMSSLECNDHTGELRYLASQLFAKAHDFALLSEEEEGQELTKGHLDCDLGGAWGAKARTDACDLSSEFSAQALLLAVANAVDSALVSRKAVESNRGMTAFCVSEQMTRSLDRLKLSRSEFDICREGANGMDDGNLDRLFAWLSLRCMVEVRNDDACVNAIESDRLLSRLDLEPALTKKRKLHEVKLVETARLSGSDVANKGHHEIEQVGSNEADKPILAFEESTIAQLYGCSCRAELSGMPRTSRLLLLACARSIVNSGNGAIDLKGSTSHSLGEIHRRLIQLSPSVFGILEVFDEVNKVVAVKARPADYLGYKQSDIDWFTIEAYNKGINLTFLGDISNAEKLLGIALNLLPACGKEVECHASEMRLAYRFAIERKGDAGMIPNNGMLCVGYD